jgi:Mg-chelatase subunit ChlD
MTNAIIAGSLSAVAKQENKSIAETFVHADLIVIVDTSGSMDQKDSRGGKSRYTVACEELTALQANHPGKIAVIAFSNEAIFCPGGVPVYLGGGTDMAGALQFAAIADVPAMQFVLISDGEPDDEAKVLRIAKTYRNKISTIYVGPEEKPVGRDFLQRLAEATGGKTVTVDRAKELKAGIETLYLPG